MEFKNGLPRRIFQALSLLLAGAFFVPWVYIGQYSQEVLVFSAQYSPWRLAMGAGFPYNNPYPTVFLLLVLPIALIALSLTKISYKKLMLAALVGLLAVTVFNIHFAFALGYRDYANSTGFFWLVISLYAAALGVLLVGVKGGAEVKVVENTDPAYKRHEKIAISALMLSMAVIIGFLAITLYIGGVPALRISFSGIFNNTTAILLGPFFGGVQRALQDLLSFFIRPTGAFLWPVTVVAFLRGAATGWMWLKLRNVRPKVYAVMYTVVFAAILTFGLVNLMLQLFMPYSPYVTAIAPRQGEGLFFAAAYYIASWGLIAAGIIGLVPQLVIFKLTRKTANHLFYDRFIKFFVAVLVPGLFFNTVNSFIIFLMAVSAAAINRGFVYWWAPRFFEELVTSTIMVYVMVVLVEVYEKAMKRRLVHKM